MIVLQLQYFLFGTFQNYKHSLDHCKQINVIGIGIGEFFEGTFY